MKKNSPASAHRERRIQELLLRGACKQLYNRDSSRNDVVKFSEIANFSLSPGKAGQGARVEA